MKAAAFARLAGHERSARCGATASPIPRACWSPSPSWPRDRRGDPRQRRRGELGLPVPVADLLAADRLSLLRGRPQPVRACSRSAARFAGMRPGPGGARRHGGRLLHRRAGGRSSPRPAPRPSWRRPWALRSASPRRRPWPCCWRMGLGLALPYLALSMTPGLQRLMPRPGPWMDRLRQFLAFPMYASAVWMIWVLTQQTGADGVIYALGGMILIAFADLAAAHRQRRPRSATWLRRGLAAAAVLLAFAAALKLEDGPATAASASGGPVGRRQLRRLGALFARAWTEAVAAGKPVFVDFTAAWCITCLVNERVALETRRHAATPLNRPERRETQGRLDQSRSRDHIFVEGTGPRRRSTLSLLGARRGAARRSCRRCSPRRRSLPSCRRSSRPSVRRQTCRTSSSAPFVDAGQRRRRADAGRRLRQPALMSASRRPLFTAADSNGKTWSLADLKGKVVVIETTNHRVPLRAQALHRQATCRPSSARPPPRAWCG